MALKAGRVGVAPDQVNEQGKILGSGGGGGGGKSYAFNRYLLGNTITDSKMSLSDSYKNYDLLELIGTVTYQGITYYISSFYSPDDLADDVGIGAYTDGNALTFKVNSNTELQLVIQTFGSGSQIAFYGYKLEEEES